MKRFSSLKIYKVLCSLSVMLFFVSLLFQVHISNATALKGKDFAELYEKKRAVEKEIAYLEFLDSNYSSMEYIEQKAQMLGYVKLTEPLLTITPPALALGNQ